MRLINWSEISDSHNKCFSFVNLYSYILLRNRFDLASIDYMSDGFLMCLLARCFNKNITRFSFDMTSLAPIVFEKYHSKRFGFIGSSSENIAAFCNYTKERFSVTPVFAKSGFFEKKSIDDICKSVIDSGVEVIIVGLGTPLQEEFILKLKFLGYQGLAFTCGGFITQTASSNGEYYPKLIDKLNLRFIYRMYKEPHTIKRYLFLYPKGLVLFIYDCFRKKNTFGRGGI